MLGALRVGSVMRPPSVCHPSPAESHARSWSGSFVRHDSTPSSSSSPEAPDSAGRSPRVVLSIIVVLVLAMATFLTWELSASKRFLDASLAELQEQGEQTDAEGCVDAVLAWRARCEAMASLCDNVLGQMVEACLGARDRSEDCQRSELVSFTDTKVIASSCEARAFTRRDRAGWKQCSVVLHGLEHHCRQRLKPEAKPTGP